MSREDDQLLFEAKDCVGRLMAMQPASVSATAFSKKWKLPFKAEMIRQLLLYRTVDLASASIAHFETRRVVPAVILTRSVIETFAVLFALGEKLERFLKDDLKDINQLDGTLMSLLVGSRNHPSLEMPKAINILTLIDKVEKAAPGFRFHYDALSEYAHPNWAGALGAYGETVASPPALKLGTGSGVLTAHTAGLSVLSNSLTSYEGFHTATGESIRKTNEYFECLTH